MIEDVNGSIDYDESGEGPTIVLVPGSCSTGAAWRPIIAALGSGFRCVTTSLLGYGGTAERRTDIDADIAREAEILETVIRRTGGPVHLVGHSFGGLSALAVALRGKSPLLSLSILEAPAPEILRAMGEHGHYNAFHQMTAAYFAAFHAGDSGAIERMIDFYGGAGTFASWPHRVRDYAVRTTPVNILDWKAGYGFRVTPAMLADIQIPTMVLWGETSHPAARRANQLLAQCTSATAISLPGAAHFMIATHPQEVARELALHVTASAGGQRRSLAFGAELTVSRCS